MKSPDLIILFIAGEVFLWRAKCIIWTAKQRGDVQISEERAET